MAAAKVDETHYYAQVGPELIEVDAEHVDLHKKGAEFTTSAPVWFYLVRHFVGGTKYEGRGNSWKDAEQDAERQIPKGKP